MNFKMKSTSECKNMSSEEIIKSLKTDEGGLSQKEANNRIEEIGYNEIKEVRKNPILRFLKRYWGPMPWLLELAMVLTVILKHYTEGVIIFILLTVNAVIGYMQSQNSQKAVEMLKKKLEIKAKVLRDGKWTLTDARYIVPGDIISIKLGDLVPADVSIISGEVSADESALTGESLPKDANKSDIIYSSSIIKRGEAKCVVVNTGINTYFGRTVELVKIARPKSKQEEIMISIVKYMMYLGSAASVVVSLYAFYLHISILLILSFIVTFLIGAIPVALPAVLTIVQAVGALDLSKKGVLVTRLDSIEDAASIDIFCFDKTGTITQNKLSVVESRAFGEYKNEDVVKMAALASKVEGMDAIDLAIINCSKSLKVNLDGYRQISYVPFNPSDKKTEAVVTDGSDNFRIIKGAAQTITALCGDLDKEALEDINNVIDGFSKKGSRTIAVSEAKEGSNDFKFVGLLAIADPPRDDSKAMIEKLRKLGIRSIMLTGDSRAIAQEIAGQVGIGNRIRKVSELEGLDHDKQVKLIDESDGFAEVYPEDKYKIVKLLQKSGHMVGMTGDGVNDSPALKQAELGTAVSTATDVARASSSIILTKPGLGEVIDSVNVSRKTYQRMLTWVINKITKVVEVVVLFTVGFFIFHNIVISLLGMSLLIFANDFATMTIATDNVRSTDEPNEWNMKNITCSSLMLGVLFALEDLFVVFVGVRYFKLNFDKLQTLVMLSLVFNTQFRILIVRERKHFWSSVPNKNLLIVSITTIIGFVILGIFAGFMPTILPDQIFILLGIAAIFMLSVDIVKYGLFKMFDV